MFFGGYFPSSARKRGNPLQKPFLYVLSFLKRKYERKTHSLKNFLEKFKAEIICPVSVIAVKDGGLGSNVNVF